MFGRAGLRAGLLARTGEEGAEGVGVAEDEPGLGTFKGALQKREVNKEKSSKHKKRETRNIK